MTLRELEQLRQWAMRAANDGLRSIVLFARHVDKIGQLKSAIGTAGESTENLGYVYDTA
jgi:hypothetical protein